MTLKKIDAKTAQSWVNGGKAILIDVREQDEYDKEHIPQAHLVPLSRFEAGALPKDHDKIAIFHCRSGGRTDMAAPRLLRTGFAEIWQLERGIDGWRAAGLPINENVGA